MAVLQKMKENLLEKALALWAFGRWKALGFYGGCGGIRTCNSTFVLQHNMGSYLLPLKMKKIAKRGLFMSVTGYGEELPPSGGGPFAAPRLGTVWLLLNLSVNNTR